MYIIKNALKNIWRSKGRNILLGIIVIMIAVSGCIALSINNAANEVVADATESSTVTATLSVDRKKMMEDAKNGGSDMRQAIQNIPTLTIDQINQYGGSQYVQSYTYTLSASMDGSSIEPYSTSANDTSSGTTSSGSSESNRQEGPGGEMPGGGKGFSRGDFTITGYSGKAAMTDFVNGTSKITSGEMFADGTTDRVCVISQELATFNSLQVGDTIQLCNPSNTDEVYRFTIKGIYQDTSSGDLGNQFMPSTAMDPANQILTSYQALNSIVTASKAANTSSGTVNASNASDSSASAISGQLSTSFILSGKEDVEKFEADLQSMGLNAYYSVTTDADRTEQSLEPLQNLGKFSAIFLLVIVVVGGTILVILNMINIRERKYEVGVLAAIGMKKWKIAVQFIAELFIVTIISMAIGTGIGAAASVPTANALLQSQLDSRTAQQTQVDENFGGPGGERGNVPGGMPNGVPGGGADNTQGSGRGPGGGRGMLDMMEDGNANYVDQVNAVVNLKVLGELLGIGLLLTLLSSGAAVIYIGRYSPLKILSERA